MDHHITDPAQGGEEGSVRLLLTKNPACSFRMPIARDAVSGLNGSKHVSGLSEIKLIRRITSARAEGTIQTRHHVPAKWQLNEQAGLSVSFFYLL